MTEETASPILPTDQEISPSTHRVKLYQLNIDTNWEDKGTGFCTYQLGIDRKPDQIIVHSEEDNSVLLISDVLKRRLYQRQQDTLIVWTEDDNRDLALSFQDSEGCEDIWKCIGKKQDGGGSMIAGDPMHTDYAAQARSSPETIKLPDPELGNLREITETMNAACTMREKDKISAFISNEHYIDKLMPLFETCEDLEAIADLNLLYTAIMAILTLNDQGLIELLVRDEYIYSFMGILEYNPKTPGMKAKHREFIKSRGDAKQVIQLTDESIMRKIDQAFRLEYLQAVLLNTESDEGLMGVVNNLIFQSHVEIINYFQNNHILLTEVFDQIRNETTTTESRRGIIRFVHQLCQLTKQMQNSVRVSLFRSLASYGLFDLMSFALEDSDIMIRTNSLNILASFTNLDVACVRNQIMAQSKDERTSKPLLEIIVEQFARDADYDLKVQYFEILRLLLDPTSNAPPGPGANDPISKIVPETDEFLQIFYDKYVSTLLNPIECLDIKPISLKGPIEDLPLTQDQAQLCLYLCEFLCFAVRNHGYRSKYILLSSDLFMKVAQLYRSKYVYIKLGALRFFRVCVSKTDEFFNQNLLKHNILESTIRVLLDTDGRDCLLNSACLDFFETIRKDNVKSLVNRSISQFGTVLDTITYISTFSDLKTKFEQNMDGTESTSNSTEDTSNDKLDIKVNHDGWTSSTVDDDEEDYFNGSDEEETATPQIPTKAISSSSITPLVNYDDDDDDDEDEATNIPADDETVKPTKQEISSKRKKEGQEEPEIMTSRPVKLPKRTNNKKASETSETEEKEQESPQPRKRKTSEEDEQEKPLQDEQGTAPPSLFKSRKSTDDEDEDDDVLAKKSRRKSPVTKKIVIKTSNIKKMRPTLH